jgi:type IV secretion system protein VirB8
MLMQMLGLRRPKESSSAALPEQSGGAWYLEQAIEYERDKVQEARNSKTIAWCVAGGAAMLALVTVVTSAIVVQDHKPNPPAVLQVDRSTGEVRVLKTLADAKIEYGKATDLFNLRRYVELRESYDWETIQDTFNAVMLMSSPTEATSYKALNNEHNPLAPVNVLRDRFRVIAKAGTVTWIGKTALVSFYKKTISLRGDREPTTMYYVATVAYGYEDFPMDDRDRGINAAGFKARSYQVTSDITKDAAAASSGAGSTP